MTSSTVPSRTPFAQMTTEEYVAFCDLIICGSEMADYLRTTQSVSKKIRKHALYWEKLTQRFKPLIKGILAAGLSH